ncbi:sugar phosphate isomerase/epimerase family protein [Actinophytocola sp.]|uniref:sugar phosphate isomerase/epimerase family protein n=1 Tax=Actinophytocola sp. TaxID=1872138 RepID=UPI003D6C1FB7
MSAEPTPVITFAGIGDEAGSRLSDQLAALSTLGWPAIELRTVDGIAVADLSEEAFRRVADAVAAAGLSVVCVDSRIGNWARTITDSFETDVAELRVLLRRCTLLGCRYVRIMSYPNAGLGERDWRRRVVERIRRLADRAELAEVVLLHENCAGWAGASAERALDLLDAVASPALGLLFDTGNGVAHGYSALDLLTAVVEHVVHVHVKDATGGEGRTVYTLPGEGDARVADCLRLLLDHGYRGSVSIEPHLATVPHQGRVVGGPGPFVAAGRALSTLVHDEVLAGRIR